MLNQLITKLEQIEQRLLVRLVGNREQISAWLEQELLVFTNKKDLLCKSL